MVIFDAMAMTDTEKLRLLLEASGGNEYSNLGHIPREVSMLRMVARILEDEFAQRGVRDYGPAAYIDGLVFHGMLFPEAAVEQLKALVISWRGLQNQVERTSASPENTTDPIT